MGQHAKCFRLGILLLLMAWGLMAMPQYARADGTEAAPAPAQPSPESSLKHEDVMDDLAPEL